MRSRGRVVVLGALLFATACARGGQGATTSEREEPRDAPADRAAAPKPADAAGADTPADAPAPVSDAAADPPPAPDAALDGRADVAAAEQDFTFFAFGDPQYGGGPGDKNTFHIQALNQAPSLLWPRGFRSAGQPVGPPRGVIIAGDLTQNGQAGRNPLGEWYTADRYAFDLSREYGVSVAQPKVSAELGLFLRDYGLAGDDGLNPLKLRWRVFEGYGNHDFDVLERYAVLYGGRAPARDVVAVRNQVRAKWPEARRFAGSAGHYSWDWDRTHFVHLNLAGADMAAASGVQQPRDPGNALTFLREDLAAEVGASRRPIFVVMHYGFDAFSEEARWWDEAQRMAFLAALRPYVVIAILHGHVHETRAYRVSDGAGKSYDVFSLGSPYYEGQPTNGGRGHFAVFHVAGNHVDAADVSWRPANPDPAMANGKDLWTGKRVAELGFQTTTTFPDGWGGWAFTKDFAP